MPELSIQLRNFAESPDGWEGLFALARLADETGIGRVVVVEHILMGEQLDAYGNPRAGGSAGGKQPTTSDGHWLDPLTVLSMVAAQTSRVRLGTGILLAALRPAALLAKQAATLDSLSGGRLDLGVGVGWQREEYEACGLSFEGRGARLDECLEICRRLWTEQVVTATYGDARFDRVHSMPKPASAGGVPIWVSGRATARTAARVARFGAGWIPWGDDVTNPGPGIEMMRTALSEAGRDPSALQVPGSLPLVFDGERLDVAATVAPVPELVALGITDFRMYHAWRDPAADRAMLEALVPAFERAAA